MRRVLFVQPSLQPPGGGGGVSAWALQALVTRYRVTVLSWQPVDVAPINRFYGTHLAASDFDTIVVPRAITYLPDHVPLPLALLRGSILMRYTRRVSAGYDVIIGLHNEIDFGRPGIQYVHYPTYLRPRPSVDLRWYHRFPAVLRSYYAATDRLAGFSLSRLRSNITLANSAWTAAKIQQFHGVEARVVYPPVADPAPARPWHERAPGFLAVGRIAPEKALERVMRTMALVHARQPSVTLTIVGTSDHWTTAYMHSLRRLAASLGPWIAFRPNLTHDEVRTLMAGTRYGIHGMLEEHFGMAPAEMVRAGMVVWVPDGGGQVEIVGDEPTLRYASEADGAAKICAVLESPAEQARLAAHLARQADRFSVERFCNGILAAVDQHLNDRLRAQNGAPAAVIRDATDTADDAGRGVRGGA